MVKLLVEKGAVLDVKYKDKGGLTPLSRAASNDEPIVQLLIEDDASVDVDFSNPLQHKGIIKLLRPEA